MHDNIVPNRDGFTQSRLERIARTGNVPQPVPTEHGSYERGPASIYSALSVTEKTISEAIMVAERTLYALQGPSPCVAPDPTPKRADGVMFQALEISDAVQTLYSLICNIEGLIGLHVNTEPLRPRN